MFQLLYKYLILHRQLAIPRIGVFVLEREPAQLDMNERVIYAPMDVVKFSQHQATPNTDFFNFVATEYKLSETEATRKYDDFSIGLIHELNEKKYAELPGIGILVVEAGDRLKFKPAGFLKEYLPLVAADKVAAPLSQNGRHIIAGTNNDSSHLLTGSNRRKRAAKKSWWWIPALILGLLAVAAIVYYYVVIQRDL